MSNFVNAQTINGATSGTSGTANLPGSRTNGNSLFAYIQVTEGSLAFSVGGGWEIVADAIDGSGSAALAARKVDGTENDPTFTWTGGSGTQAWHCQVFQWSGTSWSDIGATSTATGVGTTLAVGALSTGRNNSTVAGFLFTSGSNVIPTPTSYTSRSQFNDSFASDRVVDEVVATSGSSSDAVSVSISSSAWQGILLELLEPGAIMASPAALAGAGGLSADAQVVGVHAAFHGAGGLTVDIDVAPPVTLGIGAILVGL